jgi:hypothetical protein
MLIEIRDRGGALLKSFEVSSHALIGQTLLQIDVVNTEDGEECWRDLKARAFVSATLVKGSIRYQITAKAYKLDTEGHATARFKRMTN